VVLGLEKCQCRVSSLVCCCHRCFPSASTRLGGVVVVLVVDTRVEVVVVVTVVVHSNVNNGLVFF
jgi:hypothetical protein